MRLPLLVSVAFAFSLTSGTSSAQDWIASPSYYSHSPETGERVAQFAEKVTPMLHTDPYTTQGGMRHVRNSVQAGGVRDTHTYRRAMGRPKRTSLRRMAIPIPPLLRSIPVLGSAA
jgi:hypothetical protein